MKLAGPEPALTIEQATRVRTIFARRQKLRKQIARLKAQMRALPSMPALAVEHGVCKTTIFNYVHERHAKHHLVEARQRQSTQEQISC